MANTDFIVRNGLQVNGGTWVVNSTAFYYQGTQFANSSFFSATATRAGDVALISNVLTENIVSRSEFSFAMNLNMRGVGAGQIHLLNVSRIYDTGMMIWNRGSGTAMYWGNLTAPTLALTTNYNENYTLSGSWQKDYSTFTKNDSTGITTVSANKYNDAGMDGSLVISIGSRVGTGLGQITGTIRRLTISNKRTNDLQTIEIAKR